MSDDNAQGLDPLDDSPKVPSAEASDGADERTEVDLIAQAVIGVPGVSGLHAGVLGEVATYLPGRRVKGVRLREPGWEIHVVLDWGAPIAATSDAIRSTVRPMVTGPVDVTVGDIAPPSAKAASR